MDWLYGDTQVYATFIFALKMSKTLLAKRQKGKYPVCHGTRTAPERTYLRRIENKINVNRPVLSYLKREDEPMAYTCGAQNRFCGL